MDRSCCYTQAFFTLPGLHFQTNIKTYLPYPLLPPLTFFIRPCPKFLRCGSQVKCMQNTGLPNPHFDDPPSLPPLPSPSF